MRAHVSLCGGQRFAKPPSSRAQRAARMRTQGVARNDRLWMEGGWGTAAAPIIFDKANPADVVDLTSIDVRNCSYMYFNGITFAQVGL